MCPRELERPVAPAQMAPVGIALATNDTIALYSGKAACQADLESGLRSAPKSVPVRFLYDSTGSELYEQITQLEEYYPYAEEKHLLQANEDDIIRHFPRGSVVVELGCGDGSKTVSGS